MERQLELTNVGQATRTDLLELLSVTERWSNRQTESKLALYEANPIFLPFHQSLAKIRCLCGGNRSGKTTAQAVEHSTTFTGRPPKSMSGLWPVERLNRRSRIRMNVIDYPNAFEKTFRPIFESYLIDSDWAEVVKEQGRVKAYVNDVGGFVEIMTYEQEVRKFQGTSRHRMGYDEEPPQSIRDENMMRLVDTDGEEIFSMTPVSEVTESGYQPTLWIYDELYEKAYSITEMIDGRLNKISNPKGDPDVDFYFASIYDNRAISHKAADRILAKYTADEKEVRTSGHFQLMSGRIYKSFSDKHLIPSFDDWWKPETTKDYTLYIAIDPHPRVPHAVILLVVRRDGFVAVVDEIFDKFATAKLFVSAIQTTCRGKMPYIIIIDPLAYTNDPTDGRCFAWDLADVGLEPAPISASKDRDRGIIMVSDWLSVDPITNKPGIYITRNCERFRYEIMHYTWGPRRKDTALSRGPNQKPVDKDDHQMENLYRLKLLDPTYVPQIEEDEEEEQPRRPVYRKEQGRSAVTGY